MRSAPRDERLLREIARITGGTYTKIEDPVAVGLPGEAPGR
jgi:hypothetical protein